MKVEMMIELVKDSFELDTLSPVTHKTRIMGVFAKTETRFYIPTDNLKKVCEDFPFIKNAIKAGLIEKDESGRFYVTADILSVRKTDGRKGKKQFFSIEGNDPHERTTVYDALKTVINVRDFAKTFKVEPKTLKFSVEHISGNTDEVMNYVQVDPAHFGDNEEEIVKNVKLINEHVKFKRS